MIRSRNGMLLGIVMLISSILAIFIFSYNQVVRQQNIRAHHERLGQVSATLALTGVSLLAENAIGSDTIIQTAAPQLFSTISGQNEPESFVAKSSDDPPSPSNICRKVKEDFQAYLDSIDYLDPDYPPKCRRMEISFENIQQLSKDQTFLQGRDPVEKLGEVVFSCMVECGGDMVVRGIKRRAKIKRQFKIVSMVPGPFSRFTLFVPYTPTAYSYNILGVKYDGTKDANFQPFGKAFEPLKIFNGTSSPSINPPNPAFPPPVEKDDLENRGWVFLGPSSDLTSTPLTCNNPIILKMASGYSTFAGGHFMIYPKLISNPPNPDLLVVPPEMINDPTYFRLPPSPPWPPPALPPPGGDSPAVIGTCLQGFFTFDSQPSILTKGAAGYGLWPTLQLPTDPGPNQDPSRNCAASWLFPFGDLNQPSRTLMVGPVHTGLLQFYFLKDAAIPPTWKQMIKGVPLLGYDCTKFIQAPIGPPGPLVPTYADIFVKTPPGPYSSYVPLFPFKEAYDSFSRVQPVVHLPSQAPPRNIPFNVFFEFMKYQSSESYPPLTGGAPSLQNNLSEFYVPACNTINNITADHPIPGVHPFNPFIIRLNNDKEGPPTPDNTYFSGDLRAFQVEQSNLMGRITHVVDLSEAGDLDDENNQVKNLFYLKNGKWVPKSSGIYYVKRRPGASEKIKLPGKINLNPPNVNRSMMLIFDKCDVEIPDVIESEYVQDSPKNLFSVIALKGSIFLGTSNEIDAYLVALNPGDGTNPGGRLLANGVKKMKIFGGVAVWEMGLGPAYATTMDADNFYEGGKISYNPRFNPSSSLYPSTRIAILEDKASVIEITGGES
ncbi:hypothetical protein HYY75_04015 [bacterium]|nr:hypothetical protein [bacterium]